MEVMRMKKLFSMIMCLALCAVLITPMSVSASEMDTVSSETVIGDERALYTSSSFSGSTGTMNSVNGSQSRIFNISSGSINDNAKVTKIVVNVTVSNGSSGFYLIIEDPNGYYTRTYVSRSGEITIHDFDGEYPKGTWKVSIVSVGMVSTASARMRVYYEY